MRNSRSILARELSGTQNPQRERAQIRQVVIGLDDLATQNQHDAIVEFLTPRCASPV